MKTVLAAVVVSGAMLCAGAPAAWAASPITQAFIANVTPNVDFLDRSSRLAVDALTSAALRRFARAEASEQTLAANSLEEWTRVERAAQAVQAEMAAEGEPLQTGRSVAIDEPPPPSGAAVLLSDTRRPIGAGDLAQLQGVTGPAFDAAYRERQLEALRQIAADYAAYIAAGDDPLLLGIAGRELPKVRRRIADLRKF